MPMIISLLDNMHIPGVLSECELHVKARVPLLTVNEGAVEKPEIIMYVGYNGVIASIFSTVDMHLNLKYSTYMSVVQRQTLAQQHVVHSADHLK